MTAAIIDVSLVKHEVVRVTTSAPALLIAHLEALGAAVVIPLMSTTALRHGRAYTMDQASVDMPPVGGVALHLIVASEPVITSEAEHLAKVAARRGKQVPSWWTPP